MDDDLNMSPALAAVHDYMREINKLAPTGQGAQTALDALVSEVSPAAAGASLL